MPPRLFPTHRPPAKILDVGTAMPAVFAGNLRAGPCAIRHQIRPVSALAATRDGVEDGAGDECGVVEHWDVADVFEHEVPGTWDALSRAVGEGVEREDAVLFGPGYVDRTARGV